MKQRAILVAGAGGAVGFEIVRALRDRGCEIVATYRTARDGLEERLRALGATPAQWDIADEARGRSLLRNVDGAVFTPILTVSESAAALAPDKGLIFFSSNNVAIDPHAPVYAALRAAEKRLRDRAPAATILRPTMIYGYCGDGNLSVLMNAMRRFPVTPRIGNGKALQQPVYFKDVAAIAADMAASEATAAQTIAIAGPAPVTQTALYRAVRDAAGANCLVLPTPAPLAGAGARLVTAIGLRAPLSLAQIERANQDKVPMGDNVVIGETALAHGLRQLAAALDDTPAGA